MSSSTVIQTLFSRDSDADQLDADTPAWRVGISMAATWSWGAAVAVAIAVMHGKGLIPYAAWAGANMLALPTFGLAYTYFPHLKKWKNLLPMLLLWLFIGFFAVVMNLSALRAGLAGGVGGSDPVMLLSKQNATILVFGIGLLIAWYIHRKGLKGSVFTDVGQLALQFLGAIGIVVAGVLTGATTDIPMMVGSQQSWMVGAVLGLLSGCIASGMQWQRIEAVPEDRRLKSALWGGGIFAVFLSIVTVAGFYFDGSLAVTLPFMLSVLAVATSTSDSGSALLQYVGQRFSFPASAGSIVTLGAVLVYPFIAEWGITAIWTFYATTRWKVIAALAGLTLLYHVIGGVPESVHRAARSTRLVLPERVYATDGGEKEAE